MSLIASQTLDLHADAAEWCPIAGHKDLLAVGTYQLQQELGKRIGRCVAKHQTSCSVAQALHASVRVPCRLYIYGVSAAKTDLESEQGQASVLDDQRAQWAKLLEQPLACVDVPGMFDIKWQPELTAHAAEPVLAVALSDGRVSIMQLANPQPGSATHPEGDELGQPTAAACKPVGHGGRSVGEQQCALREMCAAAVEPDGAMVLSVDWSRARQDEMHGAALVASTSSGALATLQVGLTAR